MTEVLRGRVVTPDEVLDDGIVVLDGPAIAWVGPAGRAPEPWARMLPAVGEDTILPGLVDVHCHGGGGASFPDAGGPDELVRGAAEHLRHGTTTLVASLVTAPPDQLLARAALVADAVGAGVLAGLHLEGPFLSPRRCGAQNPKDMLPGDPGLVREVAAAARGALVTMTVAAEVPGVADGGDDVLAALARSGAVPSHGHTDGSAEQVEAAIRRGRDLLSGTGRRATVTHLFNGMRPLHHRDPGPVAACLAAAARGEVVVELVADGTHLAAATVRAVFDLVDDGSVVLVTDAMAAAGMSDGEYRLGPQHVRVAGGVARIVPADGGEGAIAGSVAHLLDVLRCTVGAGVPLQRAVRAASLTGAGVLGRTDVGALLPGRRADVLVTDADLHPRRVLRAGVPVAP